MVKFDSFTTGAARFPSGITGAVSFWKGLAGRGAAGVVAVFCLSSGLSGKPEGLSGVLSLQTVSVHGGWKLPLLPEPKPVLPQFPIRNLSPFPDGWGNRLHGWFSCMSGICMMSEIFRLLCSNRAFMDGSRPFGGFGSCLLRLFCLFQFCPAFCNGLSAAFCLCVPLFGSGSSGLGHAGSKIPYSL